MNIDVIYHILSFGTNVNMRHINMLFNHSFWKNILPSIMNIHNVSLITKYKDYLKQDDINVIDYCVRYKININYILDMVSLDYIHKLIGLACINSNIYFLQNIKSQCNVVFNSSNIASICDNNNKNMLKFMLNNYKSSLQDNKIIVVKYLIKNGCIKLLKSYANKLNFSRNDYIEANAPVIICKHGHMSILEYLHEVIGLDKEDFSVNYGQPLCVAIENNNLNVVKYLHKKINVDFKLYSPNDRDRFHTPVNIAITRNLTGIIDYLCKEIKMSIDDFSIVRRKYFTREARHVLERYGIFV